MTQQGVGHTEEGGVELQVSYLVPGTLMGVEWGTKAQKDLVIVFISGQLPFLELFGRRNFQGALF